MSGLTAAQQSGRACALCGERDGAMVPLGRYAGDPRFGLFAHPPCRLEVSLAAHAREIGAQP